MQRITHSTAALTPDATPDLTGVRVGYWTGGSPGGGIPATKMMPWWFNLLQEELMALLADQGISPDPLNSSQILEAIRGIADARIALAGGGGGGVGISEAYYNLHTANLAKRSWQIGFFAGVPVQEDEYVLTDNADQAGTLRGGSYRVGSNGGSFKVTTLVDGTPVTDCTDLPVTLTSRVPWVDSEDTPFSAGSRISLLISDRVGAPTGSIVTTAYKVTF